ncbi:aminotransferase class I/II-fold pyridoxal phosphate-dependent enzyme [Paraconexibacter antarcticus]|uniref:Aminotransferase n=1 Tax=Paraconexibacter antarcticus TaxID=2949664 RepID=A0ABY5DUT8_9ACTN|nr:aminotransferase class I/II-fold pyridoxal phosphate-dependent enzyme [Paraconexibacter antarcticus]UTI64467.1 aminotransferase class I/II-fold pyridoxal phosphate-dependent enzyme [Paraconexibacter antarcticus]
MPAVDRLPDQFFTAILARVAAARADPALQAVVDLGRGNPDLQPPTHAIAALQDAAAGGGQAVHGYPPFSGLPALREAIAARYAADHGVTLDPETEVAVIPGTKTGIMLVTLAVAGGGDAVLLPDPGYPDYLSALALAGARHVPLPLRAADGFQPDFAGLAAERPALVVLNYPSNPTAAAEHPGTFEAAAAYASERGAVLLNDFAYGALAFDAPARSVLAAPGAREVAVELWSASKLYGMAGWRVGFVVGRADVVARVQTLVDHTTAGVFAAVQHGLHAALTGPQDSVVAARDTYRRRRDGLVAALRGAGVGAADLAAPEGTFFAWWRLPAGLDAATLLREHRVAVAPGEGFGAEGAGWARLSLATDDATLAEGAARLVTALTA